MPKQAITGKEISDTLLAALALMNNKGAHWIKGRLRRTKRRKVDGVEVKEVSFCSIGAINEVTKGNTPLRHAVIEELARGLPSTYGWAPKTRVISWNDNSFRGWSEIARNFRAAATRARRRKMKS